MLIHFIHDHSGRVLSREYPQGVSPGVNRKRKTVSILSRAPSSDASKIICMQDGAPPRKAKKTQDWCRDSLPVFSAQGVWPGSSPDFNPIDLWAILQKTNEKPPASGTGQLTRQLQRAWANLPPIGLYNLVAGIPERKSQSVYR